MMPVGQPHGSCRQAFVGADTFASLSAGSSAGGEITSSCRHLPADVSAPTIVRHPGTGNRLPPRKGTNLAVPVAIDHVVVAVNDLAATIQDYERLGFTVTIGGEHAHRGSHNALVSFQDGSYIELIAFRHEPPVKDNTWWDLLQIGEGLVDVAVISADLPREIAALAEAGFAVTGPMQGGRHLPDGTRIAWRVARLDIQGPDRFPFLIDDLTPREQRVPHGETSRHPNGVTGIARVTIGVSSVAAAVPRFATIFGAGAGSRFTLGDQMIALVDPGTAPPELGGRLASHGPGPLEVALRGPDHHDHDARVLPRDLTHDARFVIT